MGKVGKWMRNFLAGKKDKEKQSKNTSSPEISASSGNEHCLTTPTIIPQPTIPKDKIHPTVHHVANVSKKDEFTVVAATAAAVAAAKAAAAMIQLTSVASGGASEVEEAAAIKIQSAFRAYLARKALNALKGLVKLQAMVRGQLVRKQATITLRYMQALVAVQARARSRRFQMAEETKSIAQRQFIPGKYTMENKFRNLNQDFEEGLEGNTKIVEMDLGDDKPVTRVRNSYSNQTQFDRTENRISTDNASIKKEHQQISQATSAITNTSRRSRRTCSKHFEEYSFSTALSSPQYYSATSLPDPTRLPFSYPRSEYTESPYNEYPSYPNYMANTESSRAKLCSHSAPKHRPAETFERQQSRRRPSPEGRNVSKAVRIQRSSSNVGSTAHNSQYPWFFKLDRSTASFKGSDCGSTSTALANTNYC